MAIPTGEIYLLKDVPLTATYEHTIDFKDKDEQFNYFRTFIKYSYSDYTYVRKEREYITLGLPLIDLDNVNYLIFRSAGGERLYYAFVTDKHFVNPETSTLYFSIDVMQTYAFDYDWRASYIKQAHVDRWTPEYKPIYSKTDEGLDYGTEYSVESGYKLQQSESMRWLLVTFKEYDSIITEGDSVNDIHTLVKPFTPSFLCALVPIFNAKGVGGLQSSPKIVTVTANRGQSGANGIVQNQAIATFDELGAIMRNSAIGNYIVSIVLMTYNPFVQSESESGLVHSVTMNSDSSFDFSSLGYINKNGEVEKTSTFPFMFINSAGENVTKRLKTLAITDWNTGLESSLPTSEQWTEIKKNPRTTKRDKRFESKLLCAPYRYNILTDWRNNPVIFKNEYMSTDKINIQFSYALSHNAPFRFWVKDYKKDPEGRYTSLMQPQSPDFPIISDAYYTYLLENKNTIQANLTNAIISGASGVVGGAISGGIFGAIAGGIQGALNVSAHIRSENAKQADIQAKPDSIINSNDSSFNLIDNNDSLTWYRMRICCENEEIIAEIFNISGYKVNRVEVPNTRSRTRFNYIQTVGANIIGSISQTDLVKIKEIFDRGITIWHYSEKDFNMLDYSYENIEVNLV